MPRFEGTSAAAALIERRLSVSWIVAFVVLAMAMLTQPVAAQVHVCPTGAVVKDNKDIDYCTAFKQFLKPNEAKIDRVIEQNVDVDGSLKGKMRSYALFISVSEYPSLDSPTDQVLHAVDNDYNDIITFLKEQGFDEIIVLRNKDATPETINYFLDEYLFQNFSAHRNTARFLFAFDGHGLQGVVPTVHGSLALRDTVGDGDPNPKNRYSLDDLSGRLKNLGALAYETIALLGSCYSGGVFQLHDVGGQDFSYPPGPGAHAITAAKANELAWARQQNKGTIFFELLLHDVHTQHTIGRELYPDGWFTSDEDGATASKSDGLIRLDRIVFDMNQILQTTKNPNTGEPYPVVEIGEVVPEQHYSGAFFFLESPQPPPAAGAVVAAPANPSPPPTAVARPRVIEGATANLTPPASGTGVATATGAGGSPRLHAHHAHHARVAPQASANGLRPWPQVEADVASAAAPAAETAEAAPPGPKEPPAPGPAAGPEKTLETTGSAILHHPEIKVFKRPEFYPIRGVDLSQWSGEVAFDVLAKNDVRFAYIAATEGREKRDPSFEKSWRGAQNASLLVGAYHFFSFCDSAQEQFANIKRTVALDDRALPLAIDVEWFGRSADPKEQDCTDTARIRTTLHELIDMIEQYYRKTPVIYAPPSTLGDLVDDSFMRYPIWLADFRKVDGTKAPTMKGKNPWTFWQFTDQAKIPGVDKPADLNAFFGSKPEFDAFVRGAGNVALSAARGIPLGSEN